MKRDNETALRNYYLRAVRDFYLVDTRKKTIYTTEGRSLTHVEQKQFERLQNDFGFIVKPNPQLSFF